MTPRTMTDVNRSRSKAVHSTLDSCKYGSELRQPGDVYCITKFVPIVEHTTTLSLLLIVLISFSPTYNKTLAVIVEAVKRGC